MWSNSKTWTFRNGNLKFHNINRKTSEILQLLQVSREPKPSFSNFLPTHWSHKKRRRKLCPISSKQKSGKEKAKANTENPRKENDWKLQFPGSKATHISLLKLGFSISCGTFMYISTKPTSTNLNQKRMEKLSWVTQLLYLITLSTINSHLGT